jgi:predicted DCC family thiol-disulfide oxidoreductase YuxK
MSELTVFYDGLCHVCSWEMESYKKRDLQNKIDFIDINDETFSAEKAGLNPKEIHRVFHVKTRDGRILKGVEGFIAIWKIFPEFRMLAKFAESPLALPFFKLGYKAFIKIRPFLPRKKANCPTGACPK